MAYHRFPPIAEDLKKAFSSLGVEVEIFYTTDYEHWFYRRVIRNINRFARNLRLIPKGEDIFKSQPLNLCNYVSRNFEKKFEHSQPDALLIIHGLPFGEPYISKISLPKIGWHLEPRVDLPYLVENARAFDIYNSYSQNDVDLLNSVGFDSRYLSHAVDPENFYPEVEVPKIFDVVFVGNWSVWRDETLKAVLEITDNVALYGGYWLKKSTISRRVLRQIFRGDEIIGAELNHLYNSSKIVLNASRVFGSAGLNMRFFEVLAAGSVLLTDPVPELEKHFEENTHLFRYRNPCELKQILDRLLKNPEERDEIGRAGYLRVLEQHRYDFMAAHLLSQFQEILKNRPENFKS